MKKLFFILLLIAALLLVACDFPGAITPTPGGEVTETPGANLTETPLTSFTPVLGTNTPTATESPPTATFTYEERILNGDFEQGFEPCSGGVCPAEWTNIFAPPDYPIPEECLEGREPPGCNPPGYTMRTPEFSDAPVWVDPFRVYNGEHAFKMHCASQHCRGGILQKIPTIPGEICIVEAWGQTWSARTGRSCASNTEFRSDYCSLDDMRQMHWDIVVNPLGDGIVLIFEPLTYVFGFFDFDSGIYDEPDGGATISVTFEAQADYADIAFIGWQTWPNRINDWYLDNVSVRCSGHVEEVDFPTPSPRVTADEGS